MAPPLKFTSAKKMQESIDEFFISREENKKPPTVTGLALHLGTTRRTLIDYEKKDIFTHTIKTAKERCADFVEIGVASGKLGAGGIFLLKNYGWSDKQTIEVNDITQLNKEQLLQKIKSLATIVPVKPTQSVNKQASN